MTILFCSPAEIPYGDKDQKGDYTLQQGDIIEFSIATDRRDKLQRATNIVLLNETFDKTTERREAVSLAYSDLGYGVFIPISNVLFLKDGLTKLHEYIYLGRYHSSIEIKTVNIVIF